MTIPPYLQDAIEKELTGYSLSGLSITAKNVSENYRNMTGYVSGSDQVKAYIAYRMSATYAAIYYVLNKLKERMPDFAPATLLDAGAGPGTALWASTEIFDSLKEFILYEKEDDMIYTGERLMGNIQDIDNCRVNWIKADVTGITLHDKSDLVTVAYMLNELNESNRETFLKNVWDCTNKVLVLIEPGTPEGHKRIEQARKLLTKSGACTVIPCPHNRSCPIEKDDWCHFTVRVDRPKFLRLTKNASLSYEDEKFSYVCLSKQPYVDQPEGIVIRHPQIRKGHIILDLCTQGSIEKRMYSKKDEDYKRYRKLDWGDEI